MAINKADFFLKITLERIKHGLYIHRIKMCGLKGPMCKILGALLAEMEYNIISNFK